MLEPDNNNYAEGVRFKILAQVFSVLRHDVIGPFSNATLALSMAKQSAEGAGQQRLLTDIEELLEEGIGSLRSLDDWLSDHQRMVEPLALLKACRKLVFSRLFRSGKQIVLPVELDGAALPEFSARYVVVAWLLCLIDTLADGESLQIMADGQGGFSARNGSVQANLAEVAIQPAEMQRLAEASGWLAAQQADVWTLRMPLPGAHDYLREAMLGSALHKQ